MPEMVELTRFWLVMMPEPVRPAKLMLPESESEVPWALANERFWRDEEAVVEVAVRMPAVRFPTVEDEVIEPP